MKKYKEYLILIIFTMGTQALVYFLLKYVVNDYNVISSIFNIPLIKETVYIYNLWYPFIMLVALLIYVTDKSVFRCLIVTMIFGAILGHLTYLVYPSMIIRPNIEINNITDWFLNFTYDHDNPSINCLPSMHCIYCFIIIFYTLICKGIGNAKKVFIVLFSLLIVASTLLTKQHIPIDVVFALIYSAVVIFIVRLNKDRILKFFDRLSL